MKVLITGINGFVGSNFTNSWKNRFKLYGIDINQGLNEGVEKIFNWENLDKLPNINAIIHLAGKAHDTKNTSQSKEYFDINTGLTKTIFDYFLHSKAEKFIFFSSVKAAADKVEGEILKEDVTPKPVGPYGESKIKAEEYILSKKDTYKSKGKKVYILRPCMIHGPGNKGNLNLLYKLVNKGIPWPLGAFDNKRSFCSIDNITYIVENIIKKDLASGIYHLADDETLSTNQIISILSSSTGKKTRIWKINKSIIIASARIGTLFRLPLNIERLQKLTENYVVSNQKIKSALGIKNLPLHANEGLEKTIKSF